MSVLHGLVWYIHVVTWYIHVVTCMSVFDLLDVTTISSCSILLLVVHLVTVWVRRSAIYLTRCECDSIYYSSKQLLCGNVRHVSTHTIIVLGVDME